MSGQVSNGYILFYVIGKIITGCTNKIISKAQDNTIDHFTGRHFFHPFVQTFTMFIGEFACLLVFLSLSRWSASFKKGLESSKAAARKKGVTKDVPLFVPMIPTLCDITGTTFSYAALTFMTASVASMMTGAIPVFTAILSVTFLKRKLNKQHIVGVFLVTVGVTLVGLSHFLNATSEGSDPSLGLILKVISLLLSAVQFTVEEMIVNHGFIHPLKMVGFEGFWGLIFSFITMMLASQVPCDTNASYCNLGRLENPGNAWYDIKHDSEIGRASCRERV